MSQNEQILKHLRSGKPIDPMIALKKFGSWALSSRISEIKGLSGHRRLLERDEGITSRVVASRGKKHAQYRLVRSGRVSA